jgi:F-type H+-transporting ATPase subunit delta
LSRVAKRYAKAIFNLALEQNALDSVKNDFEQIGNLIISNEDFAGFLQNPLINDPEKMQVLDQLLAKSLGTLTMDFLKLVSIKKRLPVLADILEQFRMLIMQHENTVEGELVSAVELDQSQFDQIRENMETATGKTVRLKPIVEPDILGGFVVKIEDVVLDNSIRAQLNKLREQLKAQ